MYNVQQDLWVDFATMHFAGNAARCLQTYEAMHTVGSWAALCVAVFAKFNRNKYTRDIDIFFTLKQTDTVDEYAHLFEEHMHKMLVYNQSYYETFFINRFVQGLKPGIRAPVKLQQPSTVDLAYSLAQTQEALLVEDTTRFSKKWEPRFSSKTYVHQGIMEASPADKRSEDQAKVPDKVANGMHFNCLNLYLMTLIANNNNLPCQKTRSLTTI